LVVRDKEGKPYSVRYDQVNAMLLNEFLKERKKVENQHETIAQLKSDATKQEAVTFELTSRVAQQQKAMEILTAELREQAAQIQRVSAQLAATNPSGGGLDLTMK
jgi:septal ring factor EnvC (AmiA/AmiB activator)